MATTSAKLSKIATAVAAAATYFAVTPKLAPSKIETISWNETKLRFGKQALGMACPGQRAQAAQVTHGWYHIKGEVLTSQSTLNVVEYTGAYKKMCEFKHCIPHFWPPSNNTLRMLSLPVTPVRWPSTQVAAPSSRSLFVAGRCGLGHPCLGTVPRDAHV